MPARPRAQISLPLSGGAKCKIRAISAKKCFLAVDARICPATLLTPPEAGLPGRKTRELVLAYFGTANWNSILSRHDGTAPRQRRGGCKIIAGEKLSFFVGRNRPKPLVL